MIDSNFRSWFASMIEVLYGARRDKKAGPEPRGKKQILEFFLNHPDSENEMKVPNFELSRYIGEICNVNITPVPVKPVAGPDHPVKSVSEAALRQQLREINKDIQSSQYRGMVVLVSYKASVYLLARTKKAQAVSESMEKGLKAAQRTLEDIWAEQHQNRNGESKNCAVAPNELVGENSSSDATTRKQRFAKHLQKYEYHERLSQVFMFPGMDGSPFSFSALLPMAEELIFMMGSNLWWTALHSKDSIFHWLQSAPEARSVRMLIRDPYNKCIRKALAGLSVDFNAHLSSAVSIFGDWKKEADKHDLSLELRVSDLVTLNVLAIDPFAPHGVLVITPVLAHEHVSGKRPHFCLTRWANKHEFSQYWTCLDLLWHDSRQLRSRRNGPHHYEAAPGKSSLKRKRSGHK